MKKTRFITQFTSANNGFGTVQTNIFVLHSKRRRIWTLWKLRVKNWKQFGEALKSQRISSNIIQRKLLNCKKFINFLANFFTPQTTSEEEQLQWSWEKQI